ncbi:hypothetical protein PR202_ga06857 [Eleusine coracana subsp. coracana]|uniref:Uncharacterized protein n=1 Tax=Eleusine coracana subsp. coracana TaxID=191504 RepID=A0AAV5BZE0_ELECO|nr:hypothetical protein PR202_ga06857 [Eleusine coracana subsp. coracana]
MARPATDKASLRVGSVCGKASVPSDVSGEGSFSLDGSAFRKASVAHEGSVPGEGPFSLDGSVPRKASVALEDPVPGEASVTLKGAVHDKGFVGIDRAISKASVQVKDTASFSCEGSVPPLSTAASSSAARTPTRVTVPAAPARTTARCPYLSRPRCHTFAGVSDLDALPSPATPLLSFLESTRFSDTYVAYGSSLLISFLLLSITR